MTDHAHRERQLFLAEVFSGNDDLNADQCRAVEREADKWTAIACGVIVFLLGVMGVFP